MYTRTLSRGKQKQIQSRVANTNVLLCSEVSITTIRMLLLFSVRFIKVQRRLLESYISQTVGLPGCYFERPVSGNLHSNKSFWYLELLKYGSYKPILVTFRFQLWIPKNYTFQQSTSFVASSSASGLYSKRELPNGYLQLCIIITIYHIRYFR